MNCPNCGVYNPDDRTQCYKCDEPLPQKKEGPKRGQTGRMGMWTWIILVILGALFFIQQCLSPVRKAAPTSLVPSVMVRPLV